MTRKPVKVRDEKNISTENTVICGSQSVTWKKNQKTRFVMSTSAKKKKKIPELKGTFSNLNFGRSLCLNFCDTGYFTAPPWYINWIIALQDLYGLAKVRVQHSLTYFSVIRSMFDVFVRNSECMLQFFWKLDVHDKLRPNLGLLPLSKLQESVIEEHSSGDSCLT